jgi:hypothetical protein
MSKSLVYTRENARRILQDVIDECAEGLRQVGFNAYASNGEYNLALRFFKWGNSYEFYWNGGVLEVTKAAYQMAVVYAKKRGVPVFLVNKTYQYTELE